MPLSRKQFVAAAAIGGSAAAVAAAVVQAPVQPDPAHFHILKPTEFDRALVMNTLSAKKPHKQVFQDSGPLESTRGVASLYLHMQNSLNAHEFSFGFGRGSLATLGVLMGRAVVLGLNDAMWSKYHIGDAFKLAPSNVYYKAHSLKFSASPDDPHSIYQDWTAEAVLNRGGAFMVCHNAMMSVAGLLARKSGSSQRAVLSDFQKHVLPGFQVVPAGVAVVQLAQENGWTLFALG